MKRNIAALLSLSVVLGLAGCTPKETRTERTTTKEETTEPVESTSESETTGTETSESTSETASESTSESTTETEETTTESETSDTSDTSETSKESETSETSEAPKPAKEFKVAHDLSRPKLNRETHNIGVAGIAPKTDDLMASLSEHMTYYTFMDPGYDSMRNLLDSLYDGRTTMLDYKYNEKLKTFSDDLKNFTSENIWADGRTSFGSDFSFTRADSQVFSICIKDRIPTDEEEITPYYSETYLNYNAKDASEIHLSDIITDGKAFASAIKSKYTRQPVGTDWEDKLNERRNNGLAQIASDIEKGEEIPFLLYHNAIQFKYIQKFDTYATTYYYVFSVADLANCVNMDYFGNTEPYYTLTADSNGDLYWDFDEDGTPDKMSLTTTEKTLDFMLNNTPTSIDITSDMYADDGYILDLVMYTESGFYIYVTCENEDPVNAKLLFHLDGEKVSFVSEIEDFEEFPFDPGRCYFTSRSDIMGTGHITITGTCLGTKGKPTPSEDFYLKDGIGVTTTDMTLGKYNDNGPFAGDLQTIKIKKGTPVMLIGIDSASEMAVLSTLNTNPDENELFYMACWRDKSNRFSDYDYEIRYNGETSYQLFTGPMYAD